MGVRITINDVAYEVTEYSVQEASSPQSGADTTGATGSVTFTLKTPADPNHPINKFGHSWLHGQSIRMTDTQYGFTVGAVRNTQEDRITRSIMVTCKTRLGFLNIYNVQAQPFIGTLGEAFEYYASLAGETVDVASAASIEDIPVEIPGWNGELWFYLKQLASAHACEVALVAGTILLRPVGANSVRQGRDIKRGTTAGGGPTAQAVEVYLYETEDITEQLVYPPGGWTPETEVLNVNAGETTEYTLELSASLSSIQTPTMQTFVSSGYESSSVYTVVADDGLPVAPALWEDFGGEVSVELNPDTTTLTVRLKGASGIPVTTGGTSKAFSLALASDTSGSRYSTLRIVGSGVRYTKEKKTFRTGMTPEQTPTEVGATIDNPFVNSLDMVYDLGVRTAQVYLGEEYQISGTVTSLTARGEGDAPSLSYEAVETLIQAELGGTPTYADVETLYTTTWSLNTYRDVQNYWEAVTANEFESQIFGNVQGARVWDKESRRWYRIREATTTRESIQFSVAEDDLRHADVQNLRSSLTYEDLQDEFDTLTYAQVEGAGAYA